MNEPFTRLAALWRDLDATLEWAERADPVRARGVASWIAERLAARAVGQAAPQHVPDWRTVRTPPPQLVREGAARCKAVLAARKGGRPDGD